MSNLEFKCGVDETLFAEYHFEDHVWAKVKPRRTDLLGLTEAAVRLPTGEWMSRTGAGRWLRMSEKAARANVENTRLGRQLPNGTTVTPELIATYFSGVEGPTNQRARVGSAPVISGECVLPFAHDFVLMDKSALLNTWSNESIVGTEEDLGEDTLQLLRIVYGSLCAQPIADESPEGLIDEVLSQTLTDMWKSEEFRYLMNWLAAIYQQPGINLQTNLWLVGPAQGAGKGTLYKVMRQLIGERYATELKEREIARGWEDHLLDKFLVFFDEVETDDRVQIDWNRWIKQNTVEPTVRFARRGVGPILSVNIANYFFSCNEVQPVKIDLSDRRNVFIATHPDEAKWRPVAQGWNMDVWKTKRRDKALRGFAYVLSQIKVDMQLVNSGIKTNLKQSIIQASLDSVEKWLLDDVTIRGSEINGRDAFAKYSDWAELFNEAELTESMWGRKMATMIAKGLAKKRRTSKGHVYAFPHKDGTLDVHDQSADVLPFREDTRSDGQRALVSAILAKRRCDHDAM